MNFDILWSLLPCVLLGVSCGLATYFSNFLTNEEYKPSMRKLLANVFTSAILSFIIFAALDSTNFSFMTKLAISSAVAFLGIDKALDVMHRLINLKKGETQ